jgi:CheY-like chemotaxis protein
MASNERSLRPTGLARHRRSPQTRSGPPRHRRQDQPTPSVLFVDDQANQLKVLSGAYAKSFRVLTARGAEQALEILDKEDVGVLVTDHKMPGMSGLDLCIQVQELFPSVQRILVTAYADITIVMEALNTAQVTRFVLKPWDLDELGLILTKAMETHLSLRSGPKRLLDAGGVPLVFISYASEDIEQARAVERELRRIGVRTWFDKDQLDVGEDWAAAIRRAIHGADFVVICLSKRSLNKCGFVQRETRVAMDACLQMPAGRLFLMPVRLEDCPVPEELAKYQYADVFRRQGYDRLVRAILRDWEKRRLVGGGTRG